ncbi:hypothetical protein Btru_009453 [Bulinus truncatus]|nr:hypothetical protein Btru_009453 [Bulinus truncatus]
MKPTSHIKKPTSQTKKPTSQIKKPTSQIKKPTSQIKKATSQIKKPTSQIKKPTRQIKKPTSQIKKATSQTKKATSQIKKPTSQIKKPTSQIKKPTSQIKKATSQIKKPTSQHNKGMDHQVNRMLNVFYVMSMGVALIFLAPAAMFTYVEQWHFLESLYFCYTTLSTIGFGDYVIGIHETRFNNVYAHEFYEVFAYVWILVGLAYLSLVYRYITDTMVANAQKVERNTIKRLGPELNKSFSTLLSPNAASNPELTSSAQQAAALPALASNDTASVPAEDSEPSRQSLLGEPAAEVVVVRDGRRSRNRLSAP